VTAVNDVADLRRFLEEHAVSRVRVLGVTPDALPFGKVLAPAAFLRAVEGDGVGVADYALGTDRSGEPSMGYTAPWRSPVIGDIHLIPDLETLRPVAGSDGMATCWADAHSVGGDPIDLCGRTLVKKLTRRLADRGLEGRFAFEIEGQFFEGTVGENRARDWRTLRPFGVAGHLPYLAQDIHRLDPVMSEICRRLDVAGVPWEAWNAEAAAGQFELNVEPDPALQAADHVLTVRAITKEVAHEHGLCATFMARVTADYGNGLHVHHSILDADGPAFHDPQDPDGLSELARHWIGGLMATLPGASSFLAPTPNSFRRIEPFKAVPTHVTWDLDNKSTALRVLTASPNAARVEHRMGAGDLHPHFAAAVMLAGGIAGLDERIEPPARFTKMAWGLPDRADGPAPLPRDVPSALDALDADVRLRRVLGDELVDYWIGMRRFEWLSFHTGGGDATSVGPTPWELDRYFETL
jgi:glutamine synthetase